jgi:hypothetical protein
MPESQSSPYFRAQTAEEYESQLKQRLKTEDIDEDIIYEGMSLLVKPNKGVAPAASMSVRLEQIQYERSKKSLARLSLKLNVLDEDFRSAFTTSASIVDGMWKLDKPIELSNAKPIRIGFLLPTPPDDMPDSFSTSEARGVLESIFA